MSLSETLYLLRREGGGAGGAEKVVRRFRQALGEGAEVTVLSAGAVVEGVRIGGARGPSWWRALRYAASVEKFLEGREGARIFSFERGPRCHVYRAGDGVHRKWVRLKYGSSPRWAGNPLNWVAPRLERRTMASASMIVANSKMVGADIEEYYPEFKGKVRVIYNGFEPALYHPAEADPGALRARLGLGGEGRLMVFAGSGWERKGLREAIEFLGRCRSEEGLRLVVAGKGRPEKYRALIEARGLAGRVHFAGVVEEAAPYFQVADLHILPTRYDPFSNSCLEALACGCPVMTTRGNGASEVIEEGVTGFVLKDPADEAGWEKAAGWWKDFKADRSAVSGSVAAMTSEAEMKQYREGLYPESDRGQRG